MLYIVGRVVERLLFSPLRAHESDGQVSFEARLPRASVARCKNSKKAIELHFQEVAGL